MAGQTFYFTNTQSAKLTNAGTLVVTAGSPGTLGIGTKVGQLTGFGQWNYTAQNTLYTPLSTLPTVANGGGWLLGQSALNLKGQQIPSSALWSAVFRGSISAGSCTVDSYLVYYVYNTISQVYTFLGFQEKQGGTWATATSNHSITASAIPGVPTINFGNADTLYVEAWFNVTANSSGSNLASLQLILNNSALQGNASSMQFAVSLIQTIPVSPYTGAGFHRENRFNRERKVA